MTINKFQGKTKEEAIEKAKSELGAGAVIMNVKEIKPKGFFGIFKSSVFEVTAALEEKEAYVSPMNALNTQLNTQKKLHDNINLAADEKIELPKPHSEEKQMPEKRERVTYTAKPVMGSTPQPKETEQEDEKEKDIMEI